MVEVEIVMNEMQKLRISADFFSSSSHIILGVHECEVLLYIC